MFGAALVLTKLVNYLWISAYSTGMCVQNENRLLLLNTVAIVENVSVRHYNTTTLAHAPKHSAFNNLGEIVVYGVTHRLPYSYYSFGMSATSV